MRKVLLLVLLLWGCAQPLSQQVKHGYEQADQYVLRTEMLIDAGAISKTEAQRRLDLVKQARTGLDLTAVALAQCGDAKDCKLAQERWAAADATLLELEKLYLTGAAK